MQQPFVKNEEYEKALKDMPVGHLDMDHGMVEEPDGVDPPVYEPEGATGNCVKVLDPDGNPAPVDKNKNALCSAKGEVTEKTEKDPDRLSAKNAKK